MRKPGLLGMYRKMRSLAMEHDISTRHQLRVNAVRTIIRVKKEPIKIPLSSAINIFDSSIHDYDITEAVSINILYEYDSVEAPDGTKGFAVFVPDTLDIWVAADIPDPEYNVPHSIAHEYAHFIQYAEERPYDEQEADAFAERIMQELGIRREE